MSKASQISGDSAVTDTKDFIINQLRREVNELRRTQEDYNELVAKVESLEYLN